MNEGRFDRAMRFALKALPPDGALPWSPSDHTLEGLLAASPIQDRLIAKFQGSNPRFSQDGKLILTRLGAVANLWGAGTGRPIAALVGHLDNLTEAMFSADGNRILTASRDKTLRIWNATTGQLIHVLSGNMNEVTDAHFIFDGKYIASYSRDRTLHLWMVDTGKELAFYDDANWSPNFFSPASDRVVLRTSDYKFTLLDLRSLIPIAVAVKLQDGDIYHKYRTIYQFNNTVSRLVTKINNTSYAQLLDVTSVTAHPFLRDSATD